MNGVYEFKTTNSQASNLSNSDAITYVCWLGFGNAESHIHTVRVDQYLPSEVSGMKRKHI